MSGGIHRRATIAAIVAAQLLSAIVVSGAQAADDAVTQAETFTVPSTVAQVVQDSAADGGAALRFVRAGTAQGTIDVSRTAAVVALRARGTSCDGDPTMTVTLDGRTVLAASIPSASYTEYQADIYAAPGTHSVTVAFTNPYSRGATLLKASCARQLIADRVTLYAYPFASASFAAHPLSDSAAIDSASGTYVAELQRLLALRSPNGQRVSVTTTTTSYGVPVYTVSPGQATTQVNLTTFTNPALQQAFEAVPLPSWAVPANGSDHTLVVWQPSAGKLWEFWRLRRDVIGRWWADWGGYVDDVHQFPGHFGGPPPQTNWGVSGSGIGLMAGLQRISELKAGVIDHSVALHVPGADPRAYRWPAQRTDGGTSSVSSTIQEGMIFRLPPDLDLSTLGLSSYALIVARAIQRYGMIITDVSNYCMCFVGEDPSSGSGDPYTGSDGIFGGDRADLTNFPWGELELLAVPPNPG